MPEKNINNVFLWYSGATDLTALKLIEALGTKGGKNQPNPDDVCMIIGWGPKTSGPVNIDGCPCLNHPNNVRLSRNKFEALRAMQSGGVSIAPFVAATNIDEAIKSGAVTFPMIGRKKFHQGGKGFWDCPTRTHVKEAISQGAEYFQHMIEIEDEFRFHVFGEVVYAVKKVKRSKEEMADSFVKQEMERQKALADKSGNQFDEATVKQTLERLAKKFVENGPNMMVRSNRLGWKFVPINQYPKSLADEALKAVAAVGLDFGAVDCCIDADGKPYVIEVNTGPGLEGTAFKKWVAALETRIKSILKPEPKPEPKKQAAEAEMVAEAQAPVEPQVADNGIKAGLKSQLEMMNKMIDLADNDEQLAALRSIFKKVF